MLCMSFYLSDWPSPSQIKPNTERNGPIHTECKIILNIVSYVGEAETCGTFNNRKTAIGMWLALIALDHKHSAIPFKTDNSTTEGFVKSRMKPKHSKTRDMKWHWLIDKEVLEQLRVYWYKGMINDADYFTKHHLPIHHCKMRPCYIHISKLVMTIPQP